MPLQLTMLKVVRGGCKRSTRQHLAQLEDCICRDNWVYKTRYLNPEINLSNVHRMSPSWRDPLLETRRKSESSLGRRRWDCSFSKPSIRCRPESWLHRKWYLGFLLSWKKIAWTCALKCSKSSAYTLLLYKVSLYNLKYFKMPMSDCRNVSLCIRSSRVNAELLFF